MADEAVIDDFLLEGLTLPPPLGRGRPSKEVQEAWLQVVEQIMGRGVTTASRLARLLDVEHRTAERWISAVRRRWSESLSSGELAWRREQLYREADEVAKMAWASAITAERPKDRADAMALVLKANDRKAKVLGLDGVTVNVREETITTTRLDIVASVESRFQLAPGAIGELGTLAARLFTERRAEAADDGELPEAADDGELPEADDVVDAELVDDDAEGEAQ